MPEFVIGIGLLAIAALLAEVLYSVLKQKRCNELSDYLLHEDYVKFNELISSSSTTKLLSKFNILSFKLAKAIQQKDTKDVTHILFDANNSKIKNGQKGFLYQKGFFYFISKKEYGKAGKLYQLMKELSSFVMLEQVEILNETFITNGYSFLEKMIERFEKEEYVPLKAEYAGIISRMYQNKNDVENQNKYLEIARQLIEK